MKMNVNSRFAMAPTVNHRRTRMDLSHGHKLTGDVGSVIPIYVDPYILPGTTVSMDTSKVIRFQTMLTPVMDSMWADVCWFFVPYRLVWDHWQQMMGENDQSAWLPEVEYNVPKLVVHNNGATITERDGTTHTSANNRGSLLDYFGFPVEMDLSSYPDGVKKINALPIRCYAKIINDWFRSESLTDPINIYTGDADQDAYDDGNYIEGVARGGAPFVACKPFDAFTSALPNPQKGPTVTIPIGNQAPVSTGSPHIEAGDDYPPAIWLKSPYGAPVHTITGNEEAFTYSGSNVVAGTPSSTSPTNYYLPTNLWADLSEATSASINELRFAFQLQKYYEKLARSGSRYVEILQAFFGVRSQDARLQRAEYLGGNRFPITVSQVTNTAQSANEALGDVGAMSRTGDVHSDFTKSFSEHGCLIGVMVIRNALTYSQGIQPWMNFEDRFSWYWPQFDALGEMPVPREYLYAGVDANGNNTFGYQEHWWFYRMRPNRLSGEFRPYISGSLGSWHYGDDYAAAPSLSDSWVRVDKTNVDRTLTVTSAAANQFWADLWFNTKYTLPMSMYSIPGLIDHF